MKRMEIIGLASVLVVAATAIPLIFVFIAGTESKTVTGEKKDCFFEAIGQEYNMTKYVEHPDCKTPVGIWWEDGCLHKLANQTEIITECPEK
ncbi:MAG: hypothetical protein GWN01_04110 [Nitrosopumilaceae archaeon]|nr:hypothetical protein [Nitrosopumilaceae archaeon]NIU86533.1 hypothetical protein [Nitrosopumilaceae archaeon]NIV65250.1 hypothetical protein [Nitrosopumilaceae archaeon]NIX60739.1 hypothetical protein [Nitrosopumilaceae archaeon]